MLDRPTLKQVSERAGVSIFTASRALTDGDGVSQGTRERVRDIARELGYIPNQMARNFRAAASNFVGFLTANSENQFYVGLIAAFQRCIQGQGYNCFVTDAVVDGRYSTEREDLFVSAMLEQRAAGVVLTHVPTEANLDRLMAFGLPLVFVDCVPTVELSGVSTVTTDGRSAAAEVGDLFATQGRRNWLLVAHAADWNTRQAREEGFREAAERAGARLTVIEGKNDVDAAETAVETWVRSDGRADAVLCTNEILLNGTRRALAKAGWRVPDDVALVSFDDFPWAEQLVPPATVVAQPTREMGARAAEMMLELLCMRDNARTAARQEVLPTRLVRRGSCGSINSSH